MLFGGGNDGKILSRLAAIERKLDLVIQHLGIEDLAKDEMTDILDLVRSGQKIAAIKLYRDKTGLGLAEAKAAVEAME